MESWDDCSVWAQAKILAYCQIMDYDENPPIKKVGKKVGKK